MVEVGSPGFIAGYIFTLINYVCYCVSRYARTKKSMMMLDLLAKILLVLATFCLGSFSGSITIFIAILCLFFSVYKEKYPEKFTALKNWGVFIFLVGLHYIILAYFYQGISTILIVASNVLGVICVWWLRPQPMRFVGAINSVIFFIYQLSIKNLVGLLEIFVICSNVGAFIKYYRLEKKESGESEKTVYKSEE